MQSPHSFPDSNLTPPPIPSATGALSTPVPTGGDATGGLIPYKNSKALLSYYIGLFSALPVLGLPMGIAAVILGVKGLRAAKENPIIKGKAHAWVGIVCGAFWTLFYSVLMGGLLIAMLTSNR